MRVLVLDGPNLNLLGEREPEIYGTTSLKDIQEQLRTLAIELGVELEFFQSNHEGELVDRLQEARREFSGVVFNPGALTHYSHSLQDAVRACDIPVVEVHLSNIAAREEYRTKSVIASACVGQVSGFGATSYRLGLMGLVDAIGEA